MELYPKSSVGVGGVKRFISIFYIVGVVGFLIPFSRPLFTIITPLALVINIYLLLLYQHHFTRKTSIVFIVIAVLGFFIEVIGVNTGIIFGSYRYGSALGIKILNTPILIGFNWLFLAYSSYAVTDKLRVKRWGKYLIAPLLMLVFDLFLEQVAPKTDMWYWKNVSPPLRNYIAWYAFGLGFTALLRVYKVDPNNDVAAALFAGQLIFFITLSAAI